MSQDLHGEPGASSRSSVITLCHDLRQYVAAGALLSQLTDPTPTRADLVDRTKTIHALFEQMAKLITAAGSERPPREQPVDVVEVVRDCLAVLRSSAVTVDMLDSQPVMALGDPVLLARAINNVLDNAARAVQPHGTIVVRVGGQADLSFVEISDDGPGFGHIPPAHGRGLSIVDTAMRASHGSLEIRSGPDPGTTVRLSLPSFLPGRSA